MTTESRAAFARRLGVNKSTVTRWGDAGRLIINHDGKVDVEKTLPLLGDTRGNREDVAARHAAQRVTASAPAGLESAPVATATSAQPRSVEQNATARAKAEAEARRLIAQADKEEMERDRLAGDLLDREDVDAAFKFVGAALRSALEVFPDQVAPLVAPVTDLAEIHALLTEACRNTLEDFADALRRQQEALKEEGEA